MATRREFLRSASLISLAPTVPGFLAGAARGAETYKDGRVLVVVQLEGGNDGINTVVPFGDEGYAKHRKVLRLASDRLIKVSAGVGIHPSLRGAAKLLEEGRVAIVPGVGYPNPSRSHFETMAVWQTARRDPEEHGGAGWLGRVGNEHDGIRAIHVGGEAIPVAVRGRRAFATGIDRVEDLTMPNGLDPRAALAGNGGDGELGMFVRPSMLDAYTTADRLAEMARAEKSVEIQNDSTGRMRMVARLIKSGAAASIYYTQQGGYDTHSQQLTDHAHLLFGLGSALQTFFDELDAAKLADRVLVMCFSEFGRRVRENGSEGTDHDTAGPVIVLGAGVKPGLLGTYPPLTELVDGDLKMSVDFRRVYASVLEGWLGVDSLKALGGVFTPLPLLRV